MAAPKTALDDNAANNAVNNVKDTELLRYALTPAAIGTLPSQASAAPGPGTKLDQPDPSQEGFTP